MSHPFSIFPAAQVIALDLDARGVILVSSEGGRAPLLRVWDFLAGTCLFQMYPSAIHSPTAADHVAACSAIPCTRCRWPATAPSSAAPSMCGTTGDPAWR